MLPAAWLLPPGSVSPSFLVGLPCQLGVGLGEPVQWALSTIPYKDGPLQTAIVERTVWPCLGVLAENLQGTGSTNPFKVVPLQDGPHDGFGVMGARVPDEGWSGIWNVARSSLRRLHPGSQYPLRSW